MEDMKNLIIQSLETKGVLGQIRAKLRSAVFKIVDEQDQQFNMGCGLKWENPTLYKILETKIGTLLAEIIREFMEYFRMDYSLSIFIPECGISPERLKKEEIFGKMGLLQGEQNDKFTSAMQLPILYYVMYYFIDGLKNNPQKLIEIVSKAQDDIEKKADEIIDSNIVEYLRNHKVNEDEELPLSNNERNDINNNNNINKEGGEPEKKNTPPNNNEKPAQKTDKDNSQPKSSTTKSHDADDATVKRKSGLSLDDDEEEAIIKEKKEEVKKDSLKNEQPAVQTSGEKSANKEDGKKNVEDDIIEDIPVEDLEESINGKGSSNNNNNSQTVSASQGYDNTVDSKALENYNYVEGVAPKKET